MSAFVIWLSHTEAKVFHLEPGKEHRAETFNSTQRSHGSAHDPHKKQDAEKFFHELAGKLKGAKEILLMGPGTAKEEFRHHLEKHHHHEAAKAIVGMEKADKISDAQILAQSRKFFKSFDAYSGT